MGTAHGLAMIKCVRQGEDEWVMEWDWSAPDARATYLGHLRDFFADFGLQLVDQNVDEDFIHEMKVEIHTMTQTAVTAFTLLNTKNIEAEIVTPDAALQRARARRGRLPLVTYKVLKVRLPKPQRGSLTYASGAGDLVALHWRAGHLKRYTAAAPLFGRYVGMWYWSPSLIGRAERIVNKTYEIQSPASE